MEFEFNNNKNISNGIIYFARYYIIIIDETTIPCNAIVSVLCVR